MKDSYTYLERRLNIDAHRHLATLIRGFRGENHAVSVFDISLVCDDCDCIHLDSSRHMHPIG